MDRLTQLWKEAHEACERGKWTALDEWKRRPSTPTAFNSFMSIYEQHMRKEYGDGVLFSSTGFAQLQQWFNSKKA